MIYEYNGYYIKPHKQHPVTFIIVTTGQGGKIPQSLSGMYTNVSLAKRDIDAYLNTPKPNARGRKRDDEEGNESGD